MGVEYSHAHAACLAAQLPQGARCLVAEDPHERWDEATWLLWDIENNTRVTRWAAGVRLQSEGDRPPEPRDYPGCEIDREIARIRFNENKRNVDEAFGI